MLHLTVFHLIPESVEKIGQTKAMGFFFLGIVIFGILELYIIPEHPEVQAPLKKASPSKRTRKSSTVDSSLLPSAKLIRASLVTFVAMALHNLPEGLGVYLSSLSNPLLVFFFI